MVASMVEMMVDWKAEQMVDSMAVHQDASMAEMKVEYLVDHLVELMAAQMA